MCKIKKESVLTEKQISGRDVATFSCLALIYQTINGSGSMLGYILNVILQLMYKLG